VFASLKDVVAKKSDGGQVGGGTRLLGPATASVESSRLPI